jgi:hypothetical protein
MLNDKTVDFLSDGIDCAIRVGAEVDPATVSVLLAEVPQRGGIPIAAGELAAVKRAAGDVVAAVDSHQHLLSA